MSDPPNNRRATDPKAQLNERGLRAKHHLSQNFLRDANIAGKIAELIDAGSGTTIEIGAGLGALTRPLLQRGAQVVAVERDPDMVTALSELEQVAIASGQLRIVHADARNLEFDALLETLGSPRTLAGNLPYSLTGPLLQLAVHLAPKLSRAVFLVQREVADRVIAKPGSKEYGALSVFVQAVFNPKRSFIVRRGAFFPEPAVDSAVLCLSPLDAPLAMETPTFQALVHAAFQQRRKTLRNAWRAVVRQSDELELRASRAAIDLNARGETLHVSDFWRMAREIDG